MRLATGAIAKRLGAVEHIRLISSHLLQAKMWLSKRLPS
jgi:hypothetical protein